MAARIGHTLSSGVLARRVVLDIIPAGGRLDWCSSIEAIESAHRDRGDSAIACALGSVRWESHDA